MNGVQESLPLGVTLKETIASKRGQQWVEQCMNCGTLACVSSSGARHTSRGQLGPCPACGHESWSLQHVPPDGLGMIRLEPETAA